MRWNPAFVVILCVSACICVVDERLLVLWGSQIKPSLILLQFMLSIHTPIRLWCSGNIYVRLWHTQTVLWAWPEGFLCSLNTVTRFESVTRVCQEGFCFDFRDVPPVLWVRSIYGQVVVFHEYFMGGCGLDKPFDYCGQMVWLIWEYGSVCTHKHSS